jgi:arylsulfatase A-like enzyme
MKPPRPDFRSGPLAMRPFMLLSCSLIASLASCGQSSSSDSTPKYNVVLISMDSVRADRLGIYGHTPEYAPDVAVTPTLDALAVEGTVFEQCWATSSWTLPSHMAIMTGLTDPAHGVVHDYFKLDPKRTTLAQSFAAEGYKTAGYYSGPYLDPKYGFGAGFEDYQSGMMPEHEVAAHMQELSLQKQAAGQNPKLSQQEIVTLRDHLSHEDISSPRINAKGLEFLEYNQDEPFFLFLHYFDAHYDHIPEKMEVGLGEKFDPAYSGNFSPDRWYFNPAVRKPKPGGRGEYQRLISERDLGHIMAWYDAEIHWIDRHIGQVVAKLKELGLYENTIIAVVADHGDEFFEHGSIGHRSTLYPELQKVPLLIRVPDMGTHGSRVEPLVTTYDLAPTLLELAGLPSNSEMQGNSLRALLQGKTEAPRSAFSHISMMMPVPGSSPKLRLATQEAWRDQRYTIMRTLAVRSPVASGTTQQVRFEQVKASPTGLYSFFDRKTDPLEQKPLTLQHSAFPAALARYRKDVEALARSQRALPLSPVSARYPKAMTEAERQMLISMGYIEDTPNNPETPLKAPIFAPYPIPRR